MKRILSFLVLVWLTAAIVSAQSISVTAPDGGAHHVASANDFATRVLQDPWDMNERTDAGGILNGVDWPPHGFSSFSFAGGIFSGTIAADPNLWLLESAYAGAAPVGRFGVNFPMDADRYRIAAIRMRVSNPSYFMFWWSTHTMFDPPGLQGSNPVFTTAGWRIYFVDLAALGLAAGSQPWSGLKRSLRLDPAADNATGTVEIDWVRLVEDQPSLLRTVTWNTLQAVDIYLDTDNAPTNDPNQTLGLVATGVTGGSFPLNVGALAPGNYYVAIRRTGTNDAFSYSSGFYQVNAPATLTITSPSEEGSADDFATVQLNDPWDMTTVSDVDHTINVVNPASFAIPAETEAGVPLGDVNAFLATSTAGVHSPGPCESFAKPAVYLMHPDLLGATRRIDPHRYRILTAELGLHNKARDICGGSIVRIVWQVAGEPFETYSDDIILNSRAGANVLSRINLDMATLAIEPGSPSQAGWVPGSSPNPGISGFRVDPHEFADPTTFFIGRVKLAALERADTSYTVRWTSSKAGGTVRVYYGPDRNPATRTLIGSTSASSRAGSLVWSTASLPHGAEYYVYVEFDDGQNVNGAYSKWPVVIDHSASLTARLVLNRSTLNFGVTALTIKTPPQTVRLTMLDAPAGEPCWTVTSDLPFLQITPGSGCGSGSFHVSLADQAYAGVVDYFGVIRVSSTGARNSPQVIQTAVRVRNNGTAPPGGMVDTPADGAGVSGSVAFTGWAVDDVGVARIVVCRDPVAPESPGPQPLCAGRNQIYIGDAVLVEDARPDIESYSPATPLNYKAGYGFLVLTNMLPGQGNGTFVLHLYAFDIEGHGALLGSRAIVASNANAVEPFGAIDTPAQGETISGSGYANFGWVLSRVNRADPPGGGSVSVFIDGVAVGSPCCWSERPDLNALFPGYPGLSTALGVFGFDTYAYGNGVHTIVWGVTDDHGVSAGIGSRFFSIFNTGSALTLGGGAGVMRPAGPDVGRRVIDIGGVRSEAAVATRLGFSLRRPMEEASRGRDGVPRVRANERERVEIRIAATERTNDEYAGYLVVDGRLRELPVGSSFDPATGSFFWNPGLGYVGDYDLMVVRTRADASRERIPVRLTVGSALKTQLAWAHGVFRGRLSFYPALRH